MSNNKKAMMKFKIGTLILLTFLASCHRQTTDETLRNIVCKSRKCATDKRGEKHRNRNLSFRHD